jgi:uncharacterized protein (DUF433 family)
MTILAPTEIIPLRTDADGVIRVSGTRVTLDTVVQAFQVGATAEEIAQQHTSVPIGDIYSVIGYYLHHQGEVDAYLNRRRQQADAVRRENESRWDPAGVRQRLLARRSGNGA